jgi:dUTP pyrophosphatase
MRRFTFVTKEHQRNNAALLPVRKTRFSAGYDFLAPTEINIKPREQKTIWTDVKAFMQPDECLLIQVRSSLGVKHGIMLANGLGIIDSDYYSNPSNDGNIGINIKNTGKETVVIPEGEGFAQGIFINYLTTEDDITDAARTGGFGSTNG